MGTSFFRSVFSGPAQRKSFVSQSPRQAIAVESASWLRLSRSFQIRPSRGEVELAVAALVKEDESPHGRKRLPHEFLKLLVVAGIVPGPGELPRDLNGQVCALPRRQKDRVAQADALFLAEASV